MKRFFSLLPFLLLGIFPGGAQDLAVEDLLNQEGRTLSWDPYRMVGVLREGERRVVFRPDLPWALGDYRHPLAAEIWVDDRGQVRFSEATALLFRRYLEGTLRQAGPLVAAVIIDPGHGGRDSGAVGRYTSDGETRRCFEKDITLQIAKELGAMLTAAYPNRKILLTREEDRYLSLEERTKTANEIELEEHEAMIFISIHANSSFNTKARGFEVWYLPQEYRRDLLTNRDAEGVGIDVLPILNTMREEEFTRESIYLAKAIADGLGEQIGGETPNRGLKEESWFVVRDARMPSVLIEAGFISHPEEAAQLHDDVYLKKMALGLYNGVRSFLEGFEQTKGFTE